MFYPCLDAWKYKLLLAQEVEKEAYRPKADGTTFCNFFVREVCRWFKWNGFETPDKDQAGEIVKWMIAHPEVFPQIEGTGRMFLANRRALQGQLVIAGDATPGEHSTGHVCIVAPERMRESASWKELVPSVANVGKKNGYDLKLSECFHEPPTLFVYKGVA